MESGENDEGDGAEPGGTVTARSQIGRHAGVVHSWSVGCAPHPGSG